MAIQPPPRAAGNAGNTPALGRGARKKKAAQRGLPPPKFPAVVPDAPSSSPASTAGTMGSGEARAGTREEHGLTPRPPKGTGQEESSVPGRRLRPAAQKGIPDLTRTQAYCLCYIADCTDEKPGVGCPVMELEEYIAETLGRPIHDSMTRLFELRLIETPVNDNLKPLNRNTIANERGLALSDQYKEKRREFVPDREQPEGVKLDGDGTPLGKVSVDRRQAPTGDFGNAVGSPAELGRPRVV